MSRICDSPSRGARARRTRRSIVDAARRLHGDGVLDPAPIAGRARVSVATIRKHFPTREALLAAAVASLVRMRKPSARLIQRVRLLFSAHESVLERWSTYERLRVIRQP